ncbi:hypothetical protein PCA31118_02872 [Pandoraea captiosa]|uniref:Uncharacterized protein n=1 Tax=Pandoraea captiosa TaxID=2508302 RepID=A0A5E5A3Z1_9BURK|nr:hypothetical protein [Pandoraea captiosa]VVE68339.1 hypothetical protein PCA31118_02872 [Pandoraea captiosa]
MRTVRRNDSFHGRRVVQTLLICLLMGYRSVAFTADTMTSGAGGAAGAADTQASAVAVPPSTGAMPKHDHALPLIEMRQKDNDKPCSFSLYDGQKINFRNDSSGCVNDEYYFFKITGAHEGMWVEIQNNPDCGYNESYAAYVVSFQDTSTGDIGATRVELSQHKAVGTRLLDGNGKPYLVADGWRGSSQLQGAVSCVKVGALLPDGPFAFESSVVDLPGHPVCLGLNSHYGGTQSLGVQWCDSAYDRPMQAFYGTLTEVPVYYAQWIPRTKAFTPFIGVGIAHRKMVANVKQTPTDAVAAPLSFDEATGRLTLGGLLCAFSSPTYVEMHPCTPGTPSPQEVWKRVPWTPVSTSQ